MTSPAGKAPAVQVSDLEVTLDLDTGPAVVVDRISFSISAGEIMGMIGESGSGKSMTALAMAGMLPHVARVTGGRVLVGGQDLTTLSEPALRQVRGGVVGLVFQDSLSSLNPLMPVGAQIREALRLHGASRAQASRRAMELLGLVGMRQPARAAQDYPHQLSGGMRQRVMLAIAVANEPQVLVADEPTTGLDVSTQAGILRLLRRLRDELGTAVMLISHDIALVEEVCDSVTVLYAGRMAEVGPAAVLLKRPDHPYTAALMQADPRFGTTVASRLPVIPGQLPRLGKRASGCAFAARCTFAASACQEQPALQLVGGDPAHHSACWIPWPQRAAAGSVPAPSPAPEGSKAVPADAPVLRMTDVVVNYRSRRRRGHARTSLPAVDGVSIEAWPGRVLGLVGESGSGKTTLARLAVGLVRPDRGSVEVDGRTWAGARRGEQLAMRRSIQLVFQDPLSSLNPRWTVGRSVTEPYRTHRSAARREPAELMELVGLSAAHLDRYPEELSGGQRQRVGIARALAVGPKVIVADEPVSALDVSVQAQIINLLCDLRDQLGLGIVVVSHDLTVIRHLADDVAVMYLGRVVETGTAQDVFTSPRHPYTRLLLESAPGRPEKDGNAAADSSPDLDLAMGCRFRGRCPIGPLAQSDRTICETVDPALSHDPTAARENGHSAACHFAAGATLTAPVAPARSAVTLPQGK